MNRFKIIAVTHKTAKSEDIAKYYISDDKLYASLKQIREKAGIDELMYLATCNRVEFLIVTDAIPNKPFLESFLLTLNPRFAGQLEEALNQVAVYEGEEALLHLFNVTSSMDSMVVGEREIISQVRIAYENCMRLQLTGDLIRLVVKQAIITAKRVYSDTDIAKKPVSVVSLAYRKLKALNVKLSSKFLIIGAGKTNTSMAKYLKKHGFTNLIVFNRTLSNAQKLAKELNALAFELRGLSDYKNGFDVIITCTGSTDYIITSRIYKKLLNGDDGKKTVIDLAMPNNFNPEVANEYKVNLISINNLKTVAEENLQARHSELVKCEAIIQQKIKEFQMLFKERKVELAMKTIPEKVKKIRLAAINDVFAKDLEKLDLQSRETLDKVLSYMEKKYISVPMKMAKDVFLSS